MRRKRHMWHTCSNPVQRTIMLHTCVCKRCVILCKCPRVWTQLRAHVIWGHKTLMQWWLRLRSMLTRRRMQSQIDRYQSWKRKLNTKLNAQKSKISTVIGTWKIKDGGGRVSFNWHTLMLSGTDPRSTTD